MRAILIAATCFPRDCRYLLSSRPTGYPAGAFNALGFEECDLLEFDEERIRAYTTNWHTAIRLAHNEPKDEARTKGEEDAKRVIASFETNPYIQDLAKNPLMLSAICLVYEFEGGRLPEDRAKLYQLCVEGLLHNWDERRRIRSPFPFSEKLRACREVAITMQSQSFAELDAPKVKEVFTAVLQDAGEAEAFLAHLRHRASLLVERRPDVFAFGHLTFQEYLAARAVHEGNIEGVTIQRLAEDHANGRWREVIPLYTGLATSLNARQMLEELLVQKDTEALCNILLDALSSAAVEIRQDAELRRRVLKRALTAPGWVDTPTTLPQEEIYAIALECVGTSDYNERFSAAFSVLCDSLVSADTAHLFKRLQNWRLMISTQITELIYLIHRYGDDDILPNVAGDRELYLSELPELGIQLAMAIEIERKTLPVLAAQPEVAAILPNQRIQLIRPTNVAMKNLSSFEKQLGMTWGLRTLGIPTLWEVTKNKGQGVRVAVLDTGVDAEHPVLSGRVNAFSLIDPLGQRIAATPYFDGSNHGTHVCGTIAGQATEDGVQIGLAPECELLVGAILVGEATVHTLDTLTNPTFSLLPPQ